MAASALPPAIEKPQSIEKLPKGWKTGEITYRSRRGEEKKRYAIIHTEGQEFYLHESKVAIAIKCTLLAAVAIPLYSLAYIGWNVLRIPVLTVSTFVRGINQAIHAPSWTEKGRVIAEGITNSLKALASTVWTVVRAPLYLTAMFFAAVIGILFPIEGRALFSKAESALHQKNRYHDYFVYSPAPEVSDSDLAFRALTDKDFDGTYYLAHCMQARGRTTDPHILAVRDLSSEATA